MAALKMPTANCTILFSPYARKLRNGHVNPKNYPFIAELVDRLLKAGHNLIQVGGDDDAQVCEQFVKNLPFGGLCDLLRSADTFISVDTFLQHAAWYVGKHGIVLWSISDPLIFGHECHVNLLKDRKYLRSNQFDVYEGIEPDNNSFVSPEEVVHSLPLCANYYES